MRRLMEKRVRFDDMLATVLARPADRRAERIVQWRQILDLLAQRRIGSDPDVSREAFRRLRILRSEVPVEARRETARTFAGRPIPAPLVAFLASDVPSVAGAVLGSARLAGSDWLTILPRLSPTGRGFLRHRRDLGGEVEGALASFGATDLALVSARAVEETPSSPSEAHARSDLGLTADDGPLASHADPTEKVDLPLDASPQEPDAAPDEGAGDGQIRAIISRIARFQEERGPVPPLREGGGETAGNSERVDHFRFETSMDGVMCWIEDAPRGALIGQTIATIATGPYGVHAPAPAAFRRRAPFRDARLIVAGTGPASGEWLIAGVPVFAAGSGHFSGYRGIARRPRPGENVEPAPSQSETIGLYGGGLAADSLRQLVHELRTPLNAIGGFAEMIRRQLRGPVSAPYRERAQSILDHSARLLSAVDDLDVAARLETQQLDLETRSVNLAEMLGLACAAHAPVAAGRGAMLHCEIAPDLPFAEGDPAALRRLIGRLVVAAAGFAEAGETIRVALDQPLAKSGAIQLFVTRPARLAGVDETMLLDPSYEPDTEDGDTPLLGLGFSLHLVTRLAAAVGGALTIEEDGFVLCFPVMGDAARAHAGAP